MAKFNDKAKLVYNYIKANQDNNITTADVAAALGMGVRAVNAVINFSFKNAAEKPIERVEAEMVDENGEKKVVKLLKLTSYGENLDIDAE